MKKTNRKRLSRLFSVGMIASLALVSFLPTAMAGAYTLGTAVPYTNSASVTLDQSGWYYVEAWGGNGGSAGGGAQGGVSQPKREYFYFEAGDTINIQVGLAGTNGARGTTGAGAGAIGTWFGTGGSGGNAGTSGGGAGGGGGAASGVMLNGSIVIASGGGGGAGGEGGGAVYNPPGGNGGNSDANGQSSSPGPLGTGGSSAGGSNHSPTSTNGYVRSGWRLDGQGPAALNAYGGGGGGGGGGGWNSASGGGGESGRGGDNGFTAFATQGGGGGAGGQSASTGGGLPAYISTPTNNSRTTGANGQVYVTFLGDKYTVNFDDKGGIGGAESTLSPYTVNAYLGNNIQPYFSNSVDTPSKEGYHFMGYYSAESGGDQYFDEDGARVLDWNFWTTPVTLHARFVEVYTVEYLGGGNTGGTAPTDATEYFENDEVTVLNEGSLVKTGYTFTGWKDQDGNNHAPNSKFTIVKNMTLTAQWSPDYTDPYWKHVTYMGNGNTGGTEPVDSKHYEPLIDDEVTVLAEGSLVKTGYTFVGWKDQDGNNHAPNSKFTIEKNMTLTAQWLRGAYTVNVGTGGVLVVLSVLLAGLAVVRIRRSAAR